MDIRLEGNVSDFLFKGVGGRERANKDRASWVASSKRKSCLHMMFIATGGSKVLVCFLTEDHTRQPGP